MQGATKFVVLRIIPFQNRSNELAANEFSEFITATFNHRQLCASVFHAHSLARAFSKPNWDITPNRGVVSLIFQENHNEYAV